MKSNAFILTCKTNMHAGKGTADQGVIDNLVQRDHTEEFPCIYASSLKGALREYFEEVILKNDNTVSQQDVNKIFGGKNGVMSKGNVIFHDALLLSIPARSNKENFFNTTCPLLLSRFAEMLNVLGLKEKAVSLEKFTVRLESINNGEPLLFGYNNHNGLQIESFVNFKNGSGDYLESLLGNKFIVTSDDDFKILTADYNLPVIARNQLENGESKNLFYEQIIPRESKYFFITNELEDTKFEKKLIESVNNTLVQVGANATIGYGYCMISKYE